MIIYCRVMIAARARKTNARGDEATTPDAPELLFVGVAVAPVEVPVGVLVAEVASKLLAWKAWMLNNELTSGLGGISSSRGA